MSANGSPLAVFGGARATFGIDDGADAVPVIQVALQGGEEVDLSNAEDAAGLSSDAREEARDKIQGLQVTPYSCCILHHCHLSSLNVHALHGKFRTSCRCYCKHWRSRVERSG